MSQLLTIGGVAGIYALLALGLVLVYRTSRVVNLAHGEVSILLGYIAAATASMGAPGPAALVLALAIGGGLGWAIFRLVMHRIMAEPPHVGLMMTVGIAIIFHGLIIILFGGKSVGIDWGMSGQTSLLGQSVAKADLAALVVSWLGVGVLLAIYRFTNLGLQMRAIAERVMLAAQRGVNVNRIVAVSWMMAVAAAALAGILHGERSLLSLSAVIIGVNALIAALIGGMDSVKGAIAGAFLVALSEDVTSRLLEPRYAPLAPVLIMLVIITVRPWGLFGSVEEARRV
ncbi:MAG: branched-chain amino acid ABC transporter permease [Lautropia sp.]